MNKKYIFLSIGIFILVVGLWLSFWYFICNNISCWQDRASFGSMFGSISALFSGLALAGIIVTILLQSYGLKISQKSIERSMTNIETQLDLAKKQNITLDIQRFENTFFHLIELLGNFVNTLKIPQSGVYVSGKECFAAFISEFNNAYTTIKGKDSSQDVDKTIIQSYKKMTERFNVHISAYLNNVINIISFIDKKEYIDKKFYISILVSQITHYELVLLFYYYLNALPPNQELLKKYNILSYLPISYITHPEHRLLLDRIKTT